MSCCHFWRKPAVWNLSFLKGKRDLNVSSYVVGKKFRSLKVRLLVTTNNSNLVSHLVSSNLVLRVWNSSWWYVSVCYCWCSTICHTWKTIVTTFSLQWLMFIWKVSISLSSSLSSEGNWVQKFIVLNCDLLFKLIDGEVYFCHKLLRYLGESRLKCVP